jgi:putative transposase
MLLVVPSKMLPSALIHNFRLYPQIKGKSAIHVARHYMKRERNYAGQSLWTRGFFVDTVGRNTEVIRRYIRDQEAEDKRFDQLEFPTDNQEPNNS